jgi:hypothetical protein
METQSPLLYRLVILVFTVFVASCSEVASQVAGKLEEQFKQPPHRTITIKDIDQTWPARISDINGQDVLLALVTQQPSLQPNAFDASYVESLMKSIYALGPVRDNMTRLKLYSSTANYWTGSGSYWILFVLPDKALTTITWVYLSKGPHSIYAEDTQLYNIDFMPPVNLNLDISGIVPF